MQIGMLSFEFPVVQAALSGYSDHAMRRVARLCGAPYALDEVVLDRLIVVKGRKQQRHLTLAPDDHPIGGQLMGSDPSQFPAAARALVEAGFDVVDINFGCPVPKVLGRCRGGFLLSMPAIAIEIIQRVRDAVPFNAPVTVKMRRGIDDSAESRDKFYEIFDGAFATGVSAITVHGRTVEQRYVGRSRWEFLAEVKKHAGTRTVLGSGDLFCAEDIVAMIRQTGVDGVSVARGAIGNPWIFRETRSLLNGQVRPDPPTVFEQRAIIHEHYRVAMEVHGPKQGARTMRKFGIKYSRLHPNATTVRDAFVSVSDENDWRTVLEQFYCIDAPGRHVSAAEMDETCTAAPSPSPLPRGGGEGNTIEIPSPLSPAAGEREG
jgi:nifR3 family TIM-barrel protein